MSKDHFEYHAELKKEDDSIYRPQDTKTCKKCKEKKPIFCFEGSPNCGQCQRRKNPKRCMPSMVKQGSREIWTQFDYYFDLAMQRKAKLKERSSNE